MKKWIARKYQQVCVDRGFKKGFLALFLDPGLGKTTILLEILRKLIKYKNSKGALIVAPLNPLYMTWPDEIKEWSNFAHLKYRNLHKIPRLNRRRKVDIYLVNPEKINKVFAILEKIPVKDWPFDTLIIDESSKFKETKSARTKLMLKLAPKFKYRFIANGTPTGNGFIGLFAQMKILDGGATLGKTKTGFYNTYFRQVGERKWNLWVLKNKRQEKLIAKKIKPSAECIFAEDHIDMPEIILEPYYIQLPPKAITVYQKLKKKSIYEFKRPGRNEKVIAETKTILGNMLHQICSGAIYKPKNPLGEYVPAIDRGFNIIHDAKILALKDLLDQYENRQILIGFKFKSDERMLRKHFKNQMTFFSDYSSAKGKIEIQRLWNSGKTQYLCGEIKSMSLGLNLQKSGAHVIVLYSLLSDFEAVDQFTRRLRRGGSSAKRVYVRPIIAKGLYEDTVVWSTLQKKGESHVNFFENLQKYAQ